MCRKALEVPFEFLNNKIITDITTDHENHEIIFTLDDGTKYKLYHSQDCCETVQIEDICGDLDDLIGTPILKAEKRRSEDRKPEYPQPRYRDDEESWTFYEIASIKGSVTIRWYGTSNGYYSEDVNFVKLTR